MQLKLPILRLIALTTGILTTAIIYGSTLTVNAGVIPTREEAIDQQTDWFLYQVNPNLKGRKLRSNDTQYINEWNAIRKAVDREMKAAVSECAGDQYWELLNYDGINGLPSHRRASPSFDRIADAIFYSRHPELTGAKISSSNSALAREWSAIRRSIMVEQPCS